MGYINACISPNRKLISVLGIEQHVLAYRLSDGDCSDQVNTISERIILSYKRTSCESTPREGIPFTTLDSMNPVAFRKIYCACGKIVDLDKIEMDLKLSLNKEIECTTCRNIRISKDIDILNDHFNGVNADDNFQFC